MGALLDIVRETERSRWCTKPWCTTCGSRDFRSAVASVKNLTAELKNLDLPALVQHRAWSDVVRIIALDHRRTVEWDVVLSAWAAYAGDDARFADHILFYVLPVVRLAPAEHRRWIEICATHALRRPSSSILESLVYRLGLALTEQAALHEHALRAATLDREVARALRTVGLMPEEPQPDVSPNKRHDAARNLFGAVRRNDLRAVQALLAKRPDLATTGPGGFTALEYARELHRDEIAARIQAAVGREP